MKEFQDYIFSLNSIAAMSVEIDELNYDDVMDIRNKVKECMLFAKTSKMLSDLVRDIPIVMHIDQLLDYLEKNLPVDDEIYIKISENLENLNRIFSQVSIEHHFDQEQILSAANESKSDQQNNSEEENIMQENDIDEEFISEYLSEMNEMIELLEMNILKLKPKTSNLEIINNIFRYFHTIKGNAGIFEHITIKEIAHLNEDLLSEVKNRKTVIDEELIDVMLVSKDFILSILDKVNINQIDEVFSAEEFDSLKLKLKAKLKSENEIMIPEPDRVDYNGETTSKLKEDTVRVSEKKLDTLMNLVGELVVSTNMIHEKKVIKEISDIEFHKDLSQNNQIISELQKATMALRMVTVEKLFHKMNRVVRDYSRITKKKIALEVSGTETEIDRNIVNRLSEPLIHLIRNSCDHGIEYEAERISSGKNPIAKIYLKAFHQGDNIVIEIGDDGRGLDLIKILKKAQKKGLVKENANLSEKEIFDLILKTGVSTAEEITDVSGRGLGMDIVNKRIEKLNGRIEIDSQKGKGSRFRIYLPLTLAIIDGLMVKSGKEIYVIPITNVRRLVKAEESFLETTLGQGELILIEEKLIPVVRLSNVLGEESEQVLLTEGIMIQVENSKKIYALFVDDVLGIKSLVVKKLNSNFVYDEGVSGATILSDGKVGLILDINAVWDIFQKN